MTEGYRVAERKRFAYIEVSLIVPGDICMASASWRTVIQPRA